MIGTYLEAKTKGLDYPCFGKFDSAEISQDGIGRLLFKGDFEVISVWGGKRAVVVVNYVSALR